MASVTIGGRELSVKPATLGFVRHKLIPARKRMADAGSDEATCDALAELLLVYVGHNEGVTLEWIFDNVPMGAGDLLRECAEASGQKLAAPGEAVRP